MAALVRKIRPFAVVPESAEPLIVVPQFGPEGTVEKMLRRRILDETGLPYVQVKLDPSWHLLDTLHPNPPAARAVVIAVAERLRDERDVAGALHF